MKKNVDVSKRIVISISPVNPSRRKFLAISGSSLGAGFLATLPHLDNVCGPSVGKANLLKVKLSPIPGRKYSEAALAFMRNARFETPEKAIFGMKDPKIEYYLEYVEG